MKTIKVRFVKRGKEKPDFLIQEKGMLGWRYIQKPDKMSNIKYLFTDKDKETLLGLYDGEYQVFVYDENDELVWESEESGLDNTEFDSDECEGEFLLVEDYQKGNFFTGYFEADSFDPELLSAVNREYIGQYSSVVKFKYDGEIIETDWSDTSSKGFNFYLSQK